MLKSYWLSSGLLFLILAIMAAFVWDMRFATLLWGFIAGGKLAVFALLLAEEKNVQV